MWRFKRMGSHSRVDLPFTRTSPRVGNSIPLVILSAVVLPDPLRPSNTNVSPGLHGKVYVRENLPPAHLIGHIAKLNQWHETALFHVTPRSSSTVCYLGKRRAVSCGRYVRAGCAQPGCHSRRTCCSVLRKLARNPTVCSPLCAAMLFTNAPFPDRHRIVFYLGHLEAFEGNLLRETVGGMPSFHPEFDRLFAFGIDPVGTALPIDRPEDWPSLEEIQGYNQRLREQIDARAVTDSQLLNVAIEHRLMHCETLAYMLHRLPLEQKLRPQGTAGAVSREPSADPRWSRSLAVR